MLAAMSYLDLPDTYAGTAPFAPDSEQEAMFQQVMEKLRARPNRAWTALLLVGSLTAFILLQRSGENSLQKVLVLTAVLAFHELGHFVAMWAFGYRDLRMFFIPFLGAAVSGKRTSTAAWKEAVVLLAGPAPGVLIGAAMILSREAELPPLARQVAFTLVAINGFNLLPLVPLDGGKLVEQLLFGGRRALVVPFQLLAAIALTWLSVKLKTQALEWLALILLMGAAFRWRILGAAAEVRKSAIAVPPDARDLDGDEGRRVFAAARNALSGTRRDRLGEIATAVQQLVEAVSHRRPSAAVAAALLVGWLASLGVVVLGFDGLRHPRVVWQDVTEPVGGWTARFPGSPITHIDPANPSIIETALSTGSLTGYAIISFPAGFDAVPLTAVADALEQRIAAQHPVRPVRAKAQFAGEVAVRLDYRDGDLQGRAVLLDHGGRRFVIVADGPQGTTFLESIHWATAPQAAK
jgi:Zn-dependent protease